MRVLVFPVDVVGGFPLVVGFVERVAHVVATVAAGFQSAGRAAVVVDDVDAHHVSVAEAVVADTCQRQLLDAARQLYAVFAVELAAVAVEQRVGACSKQNAKHQYSCVYMEVLVIRMGHIKCNVLLIVSVSLLRQLAAPP